MVNYNCSSKYFVLFSSFSPSPLHTASPAAQLLGNSVSFSDRKATSWIALLVIFMLYSIFLIQYSPPFMHGSFSFSIHVHEFTCLLRQDVTTRRYNS